MNHNYLNMTIKLPIVPGDAEGSLWNVCQAAVAVSIIHQDSLYTVNSMATSQFSRAYKIICINKD